MTGALGIESSLNLCFIFILNFNFLVAEIWHMWNTKLHANMFPTFLLMLINFSHLVCSLAFLSFCQAVSSRLRRVVMSKSIIDFPLFPHISIHITLFLRNKIWVLQTAELTSPMTLSMDWSIFFLCRLQLWPPFCVLHLAPWACVTGYGCVFQ